MNISTLTHQELYRPGSSDNGCSVTERRSADFVVDGGSLLQALVKADGGQADFMGYFVKGCPEQNPKSAAIFLLQAPAQTDSGRVLIYICPECGDIGCGAYSARISSTDSAYIWESFAYENGYEEPRIIEGIGPFKFDRHMYESAIRNAAAI